MDAEHNSRKDPTITLRRFVRVIERIAFAMSVLLVAGTAGYLSIHSWT